MEQPANFVALLNLAGRRCNVSKRVGYPSLYASRSIVGSLLGPTYELASDATSLAGLAVANAKGAVTGNAPGMTEGDVATVRRLTPFASLPYWRWLIDGVLVPEAKEAVRR